MKWDGLLDKNRLFGEKYISYIAIANDINRDVISYPERGVPKAICFGNWPQSSCLAAQG
jgi:hypothetical protein